MRRLEFGHRPMLSFCVCLVDETPSKCCLWRWSTGAIHARLCCRCRRRKERRGIHRWVCEASDSRPDRSRHPPRGAVLIGPFFFPPAGIATRHTVEARAGRSRTSAARTATIPPLRSTALKGHHGTERPGANVPCRWANGNRWRRGRAGRGTSQSRPAINKWSIDGAGRQSSSNTHS